jgi:hypothetical protein
MSNTPFERFEKFEEFEEFEEFERFERFEEFSVLFDHQVKPSLLISQG